MNSNGYEINVTQAAQARRAAGGDGGAVSVG